MRNFSRRSKRYRPKPRTLRPRRRQRLAKPEPNRLLYRTEKNLGSDLQLYNPETSQEGDFYVGLDPAQTKDYHVLSVVESVGEKLLLRHLKIFSHPTYNATVLGYIKVLQDRWGGFQKIRVDITREGPSFIADMEKAGIENAEGVNFSVPRKGEMASLLKKRMQDGRFLYPCYRLRSPIEATFVTS